MVAILRFSCRGLQGFCFLSYWMLVWEFLWVEVDFV